MILSNFFSDSSRLKPNLSKCEIIGIGVLKGFQVTVCGRCCVDLNNNTLKILGTHFSYNEKLKEENKFHTTGSNIQRVLKIWETRNLLLEGNIFNFKTLAISKIVLQFLITTALRHIVNELEKNTECVFVEKLYS